MNKLIDLKKYIPKNFGSTLAIIFGLILLSQWQEYTPFILSGGMIISGAIAYKFAKNRSNSKDKGIQSLIYLILFLIIFLSIFGWTLSMTQLWLIAPVQFLIIPLWIVLSITYIYSKKKSK